MPRPGAGDFFLPLTIAAATLRPAPCFSGRHVDILRVMTEKQTSHAKRQIVGFSLSPELAAEVKAEAARRNISLHDLLRELWALYKEKQKPPA
jgi:hypothetical protein